MRKQTKVVKAWAVMQDDFLPDFSITGKMYDVYQVHSTRTGADHIRRELGKGWKVVPCTITYSL